MPQNSLDNLFYLTSKDLIQARQKYHDIEILTIVDPKYKKNRMEVLNLAYSDLEHAYISWLNCFEIGCYLYFKKEIVPIKSKKLPLLIQIDTYYHPVTREQRIKII